MTIPAGLLARILESPHDDAPRLVAADWLMERGDPRGDLIALQCAATSGEEPDPRIDELLRTHQDEWRKGLGARSLSLTYVRGFIERVSGKSEVLVSVVPKLVRRAPIRAVCVTNNPDGALPKALAGTSVRELEVTSIANPHFVPAFVGSAFASQLRALTLPHGDLATQMIVAPMPDLEHLDAYLPSDPALLALNAPLRTLRLHHDGIRVDGFSSASFATTLQHLSLASADLSALARLRLPALASLELRGLNGVDERSLDAWSSTRLPLRLLWARGALRRGMVERFLQSPSLSLCRTLDLSFCDIGDEELQLLAEQPFSDLRELVVQAHSTNRGHRIGPRGVEALLASPLAHALRKLDLSGHPIGDAGAAALARAEMPALRELALTNCGIGDEGAIALAAARFPRLRDLALSSNPVTDSGAVAFTRSTLPSLKSLSLGAREISGADPIRIETHRTLSARYDYRRFMALTNPPGV